MSNLDQRYAEICLLTLLSFSCSAFAAEPSKQEVHPATLGSFTRAIQPLLLNRCAAGACHGGPQGAEPKLLRGPIHGQANQRTTLKNLHSVTTSIQHKSSDITFLSKILNHHDKSKKSSVTKKSLLTSHEQELFVTWLTSLPQDPKTQPQAVSPSPQTQRVNQASFDQPQQQPASPHQPNRFRLLLEREAHPQQFPPPQVTRGLRIEEILADEFLLLEPKLSEKDSSAPSDE